MLVTHRLHIVPLVFKTTITEMGRLGLQRFRIPHQRQNDDRIYRQQVSFDSIDSIDAQIYSAR